ncbi:MAG: hypothetical protein AAGC97_03915 [Planctomycetota bacterium]
MNASSDHDFDLGDNERDRADDAWLNSLLEESLTNSAPPDLTRSILSRLQDPPEVTLSPARAESRPALPTQTVPRRERTSAVVTLAIAASTLLAIGLATRAAFNAGVQERETAASDPNHVEMTNAAAQRSDRRPPMTEPAEDGADNPSGSKPSGRVRPSQPIDLTPRAPTLALSPELGESERSMADSSDDARPMPTAPREIRLVGQAVDKSLQRYWQRLDIQPTQKLGAGEIAEDIQRRFGWTIKAEDTSDPASVRASLGGQANHRAMIRFVLASLTGRQPRSFENDRDLQIIESVATAARNKGGLEQWLRDQFMVTAADKPDGTDWTTLVRPLDPHQRVVRTASLMLSQDLRCVRCHDELSSGQATSDERIEQAEYWSVAASIAPITSGRSVREQPLFYDLPDGRRKSAVALQLPGWTDLQGFSQTGRHALARGLVESLWNSVHRRPLHRSAYQPMATPHDATLDRIGDELSNDLVQSGFDVTRTLAAILTGEAFGRAVPQVLDPANRFIAGDSELLNGAIVVDSMAGGLPPYQRQSASRLIAQIRQSLPGQHLSLPASNAVLAQAMPNASGSPLPSRRRGDDGQLDKLGTVVMPSRSTSQMPAWLTRLPSFESRAQHMAHLSGRLAIPPAVSKIAEGMRAAGLDEDVIWQRLSWML